MAIIRPDDDIVIADKFSEIRDILVGLAGNEHPVFTEQILRVGKLPLFSQQTPQNMNDKRRPTSGSLNKAKA